MNMENRPLVSVIIPAYNCCKYISEAVESVLRQSYGNVEIIVVNDGSTDNTERVVKSFGGKIKYIKQANKGSSSARNAGMAAASGDYIAFLDADDRWRKYKLELQVDILRSMPYIDMLFTNYANINEKGSVLSEGCIEKGFPIFSDFRLRLKNLFESSVYSDLMNLKKSYPLNDSRIYYGNIFTSLFMGNFILPSTEIFRKEPSPILFNEEFKCAEDQDFHLRFARFHKIAYIDSSTTEYRVERQGKLSGGKNTPLLIMNTLKTRMELAGSGPALQVSGKRILKRTMSVNLSRLAYFHLTELNLKESRKYALESLKYNRGDFKAWFVYMSCFIPPKVLDIARHIKSANRPSNR